MIMRIAFDIGDVIIDKKTRQPIDESYMSLRLFIEKFKSDNIFIISKARNEWITKNKELLKDTLFYELTGFDIKNMYFVDDYEDKAILCNKLKIDYLIDDSVKVTRFLIHQTNTIPIWYSPQDTKCITSNELNKTIIAKTWKSIRKICSKI